MFCSKCGTQNPDTAAFCKSCGTRLNGQVKPAVKTTSNPPARRQPQPQGRHTAAKHKRCQNKKLGIIVTIALAAAVLVLVFALFGGRSYKSAVKQYFNASFDGDAGKIIRLLPDEVVDYALEESGYDPDERDELIADLSEELQDYVDTLNDYLGDNWKASYEIASAEEITGDDLEDIQEDYEDMDIKVSAAKKVKLELTVKSGDTEQSNSMRIYLIKVGRSWYLDAGSMGLF